MVQLVHTDLVALWWLVSNITCSRNTNLAAPLLSQQYSATDYIVNVVIDIDHPLRTLMNNSGFR